MSDIGRPGLADATNVASNYSAAMTTQGIFTTLLGHRNKKIEQKENIEVSTYTHKSIKDPPPKKRRGSRRP